MKCQRWALFHLSSPASTSPPANQVREKQMYAGTIHNMCVHQTVCSVYLCLSASVTMSSRPPPLLFQFLSPRSVFPSISLSAVHNFSSSALWTQVALGHDMLSFHIMVKKATRETERDEEWREDNQCGSPQKLWKQKAQFRHPPLSLSLSSIFSSNSSSDGFCRPGCIWLVYITLPLFKMWLLLIEQDWVSYPCASTWLINRRRHGPRWRGSGGFTRGREWRMVNSWPH